jgi:hypothetical protein
MSRIQATPSRPGPTAKYMRPLTFAASWVTLVALASCCFFAPRGTEAQPTIDDVVGFGCSMAISGAAAAAMAFGIGGRRRWAAELMLCVAVLSSSAALLLVYALWFDPTFARGNMDLWSFQRLQHGGREWAKQLAGYHGPLGATVGIVLGTVAGLLTILGRHRPRLAAGTAFIILFAFASGFGRQFAFDVVTWLGWILRYHFVPGSISSDQISITGMIFGAITGAVVANLAIYATTSSSIRRSRHAQFSEHLSGLGASTEPDRPIQE